MVARRKVAAAKQTPTAVGRTPALRSQSMSKAQKQSQAKVLKNLRKASAKSASVSTPKLIAALVKEEPSTPKKSPSKTIRSRGSPASKTANSPAKVKKTIAKKVVFSPETKFTQEQVPSAGSSTHSIRVGAEALVAVGAALTAWFYPLFTANLATNGR